MSEGQGVTGVTPGTVEGQGRLVGRRYRLLSPVGRGGMGMVWHAHDVLLDRDVAVKELILPFGLDHAGKQVAHRRMLREARSAARLSHPGIVTVHDVVEEDGRPWIVMELVRAWSLEQAVRQSGPLPTAQTAEIGIRVLDALRHAHAAGILHRDVKPGNVLLTQDRVVLTDFGIAAIEGDVTITQTGLLMGSPAYIPPERLQGRPITHAADLWSFGATLYAAVEGRPPYEGPDAVAVLGAVLTQEPTRPQRAGALLPVIEGLLRKNPADRISAAQVSDMLERVLRTFGSGLPHRGHAARTPPSVPTPGDPTPLGMMPPLDPPSGPLPSRIIETPSGPVRVPYDPMNSPSGGYPIQPYEQSGAYRTDSLTGPLQPDQIGQTGPAQIGSSGTGTHSAVDLPYSPSRPRIAPLTDTGDTLLSSTGHGRQSSSHLGEGLWPAALAGDTGRPSRHQKPPAEDPPPARDRRPTLLLIVAAIAVVGVVAGLLLVLLPGGSPQDTSAQTALNAPTVAPTASSKAADTGTGQVPSGFKTRTANGVSVAVPGDWKTSSTDQVVSFTGPKDSGLRIQIKKVAPAPADGGLAALTKSESEATYNEYLQVRLERATFRGWKASDWEYTYTELNAVSMHVQTRHVTIDDQTAYEITFAAPDAEWEQRRRIVAVLWDTFKPVA